MGAAYRFLWHGHNVRRRTERHLKQFVRVGNGFLYILPETRVVAGIQDGSPYSSTHKQDAGTNDFAYRTAGGKGRKSKNDVNPTVRRESLQQILKLQPTPGNTHCDPEGGHQPKGVGQTKGWKHHLHPSKPSDAPGLPRRGRISAAQSWRTERCPPAPAVL